MFIRVLWSFVWRYFTITFLVGFFIGIFGYLNGQDEATVTEIVKGFSSIVSIFAFLISFYYSIKVNRKIIKEYMERFDR